MVVGNITFYVFCFIAVNIIDKLLFFIFIVIITRKTQLQLRKQMTIQSIR